jgi:hypothetical protein
MSKQQKTTLLKEAMIQALEKSLGIVTTAAKSVGIERTSHYRWMNEDSEYKETVEDIENIALDFAESQLHKNMQKGSDSATIFYLKTKGRKRGYQESKDITTNGKDMNTTITFVGLDDDE